MKLDVFVRLIHGLGHEVGNLTHLFIGRRASLGFLWPVDIVDVGTCSVGHDADKRRVEPVGTKQLLDSVGKNTEIVGRNDT